MYKFPEINISEEKLKSITEKLKIDPSLDIRGDDICLFYSDIDERDQMITYIKLLQNKLDFINKCILLKSENFNLSNYSYENDKELVQTKFIMDGDWQCYFKEKLENHWDRQEHKFISLIKYIDVWNDEEFPKYLSDEKYKELADKICNPDENDSEYLEITDLGYPPYSTFNKSEMEILENTIRNYKEYLEDKKYGPLGYDDPSEWLHYIKNKTSERSCFTDKQIIEYCFILFDNC